MNDTLLVLAIGLVAGFFNTVAGGGSLLTLPVLIFLGLPSAVANGTNRVALVVQNLVATLNFRHKGIRNLPLALSLSVPAVLGALVGSNLAVSLPDAVFNRILGFVMLGVLLLIIWNPRSKKSSSDLPSENHVGLKELVIFFFIGIYGGFIQAGVGFVIIASLTLLTGLSLVEINSVKVIVVLSYLVASLALFSANSSVDWALGLTLAVGNGIGAWLGSTFAVAKGDRYIRLVLIGAVIIMASKFLGFY